MSDLTGKNLGHYHLLRRLGQGGFADVYLGEHLYLKMQAAVKVLQADPASTTAHSFLEHARHIARLEHRHLMRILECGTEGGLLYLIMDFAPNGTLRQRHPRGSRLTLAEILAYVKPVASALHYLHDAGLVHGDVKPENMLIGRNGEILLSDLAPPAPDAANLSQQRIVGTIAYMAPEQVQGKIYPASDQYGLGITIYEWLSGTYPFQGTINEVAVQHALVSPPPLCSQVPQLSPAIEQVILQVLNKQPHQRFPTMLAFIQALEDASQQQSPAPEHSPSSLSTVPRPRRIARRAVGLGLASLGVGTLAGGFIWRMSTQSWPFTSQRVPSPLPVGTTLHTYLLSGGIPTSPTASTLTPTMDGTPLATIPRSGMHPLAGTSAPMAWSPNSKEIFLNNAIWEATSGKRLVSYNIGGDGLNELVSWSPDGRFIALAAGENQVTVHASATGTILATFQNQYNWLDALGWSPDSKYIVSGLYYLENIVQIWDIDTQKEVFTYSAGTGLVTTVGWSPNWQWIAFGSADFSVQVWIALTGKTIYSYRNHIDQVLTLAWAPDSRRIVSGSADKTAQVWDALTGEHILIYRGHADEVTTVGWSSQGKVVASGSADGTVQIWSASTGNPIFTYTGHHNSPVISLAWSPNGQLIASASQDGVVKIWNAVPLTR